MIRRTSDPFWWLLFAAGGTVAAFVVPILIVLIGFMGPLGLTGSAFAYERLLALVSHPLTRLALLVIIALPFFHWAHRFRYTLEEGLKLKAARRSIATACYGAAVAATLATVVVLLRF